MTADTGKIVNRPGRALAQRSHDSEEEEEEGRVYVNLIAVIYRSGGRRLKARILPYRMPRRD